jgi:aminoglycoside phosphotransferase (APT) family kinase protein
MEGKMMPARVMTAAAAFRTEPLSGEECDRLAQHYGADPGSLSLIGEGATAFVYGLGADWVVRIPRGKDGLPSLRREVEALPVAARAGVDAPTLVAVDDPPSILDVEHSILTRVRGLLASDALAVLPESQPWLEKLGAQLRRLHDNSAVEFAAADAFAGRLRDLRDDDNGVGRIPELVDSGLLSPAQGQWAFDLLARLEGGGEAFVGATLLHGDVRPTNVALVSDGKDASKPTMLDWGDAAIGPAVVDFGCLPPWALADVLRGYQASSPSPYVDEAAVLRVQLGWALASLGRSPRANESSWSAPPAGRLLELMRFGLSTADDRWQLLSSAS